MIKFAEKGSQSFRVHRGGTMVARLGQALVAGSLGLFFSTSQASVTSLTCIPATIGGGTGHSSSCTVVLSSPAPAGGSVVTLTSSLTELATSCPASRYPPGKPSKTLPLVPILSIADTANWPSAQPLLRRMVPPTKQPSLT